MAYSAPTSNFRIRTHEEILRSKAEYKNCSREEAENYLCRGNSYPFLSYVIRPSTTYPGYYVITFRIGYGFCHHIFSVSSTGIYTLMLPSKIFGRVEADGTTRMALEDSDKFHDESSFIRTVTSPVYLPTRRQF